VKVTGLDTDPSILARARRRAAEGGLEIRFDEGRSTALPYQTPVSTARPRRPSVSCRRPSTPSATRGSSTGSASTRIVLLALLVFGGKRKSQKKKADKHLEAASNGPGARNANAWSLSTIGSVPVTSIRESATSGRPR
jgi:hypothetical protein